MCLFRKKSKIIEEKEPNYIKKTDSYTLEIFSDIMSDETLQYANKVIEKYFKEEDKILDYFLDIELRDFYKTNFGYSDEYIKENLGRPYITINAKNDGNWNSKFKYVGTIDYTESKLDEHMISIEFNDDLKFKDYMQFNG